MGKVIKFPKKKLSPHEDRTYDERTERIRKSIERINQLMEELKGEKQNDDEPES
jgi:hypothetical protein